MSWWRSQTRASEGARGEKWRRLDLNYGISLSVPHDWRTDSDCVAQALKSSLTTIDARELVADETGHLLALAPPLQKDGEISLSIQIMPTTVSQGQMAILTDATLTQAESEEFCPEVVRALMFSGSVLTKWNAVERLTFGGRHALLIRYEYSDPAGREMMKATYAVYLGSRSVNFHILQQRALNSHLRELSEDMLMSISIAASEL